MNNFNLGIALIKSGKLENAIEFFTKYIVAEPENAEAYYHRAKCYTGLNKQSEAMNDLQKSIDLQEEIEDLLIKEADYFENLHNNPFFVRIAFPEDEINNYVEMMYEGEFEKATNELDNYIKTGEFNYSAYFFLSLCYYQISEFEKAISTIDTYIEKNPVLADAYFNKACIHEAMNNFKNARDEYKKALSLDESNPNIWYNLANIYLMEENLSEALIHFDKTLEINPSLGLALFKRAIVFSKLDRKENARKDLKKLIKIDPNAKKEALNNEYLKDLV